MLEEQPETLYTTNKYEYKNLSHHNRWLCSDTEYPLLRHKDGNFVCTNINTSTSINNTYDKQQVLHHYDNSITEYNKYTTLKPVISIPGIIINKPILSQYKLPNGLDNYVMTTPTIFSYCKTTLLIPKFIIINGKQYNKQKLLGCGSYSQVYEYMSDELKKYSIKILYENTADIMIAKYLTDYPKCNNYIIEFYILKNNIPLINESYLLMEQYEGNLSELDILNTFNDKEKIKIILKIIYACICFKNNGLYYTDIKPYNILYKYISFGSISCVFGDIGSFVINDTMDFGTTTFPHPFLVATKENFEKVVIWGLLVLFMTFYDNYNFILEVYVKGMVEKYVYNETLFTSIKDNKIKSFIMNKMFATVDPTDPAKGVVNIPETIEELYNDFLKLYSSL